MNLWTLSAENYIDMKRISLLVLLCLIVLPVFGEVSFSGLDVNETEKLLFRAQADSPVNGSYDTLLLGDLKTNQLTQLSFFPEEAQYLRETEQLQIQNRYGVFRTDEDLRNISPVAKFPAFVNGTEIQTGKINPALASPDGKWFLFQKPHSVGYASLVLYNARENKEHIVADRVLHSLKGPEAVWSPNSKVFIYVKQGALYYYSINQHEENRILAEEYRMVGKGKANNVCWNREGNLYYVSGSRIYRILGAELFTRSIYSNLLQIGTIVGKIPFTFDPNFDDFWISPEGGRVLLSKGERNLFMYILSPDDFTTTGDSVSHPYLFLPRNTQIKKALWTSAGQVTLLAGSILHGEDTTAIYRLGIEDGSGNTYFFKTEDKDVRDIVLSPSQSKVALVSADRIEIKDYRTWKDLSSVQYDMPLHCIWKNETELIVAGAYSTKVIPLSGKAATFLFFSQPGEYGFSKATRNVIVKQGGDIREYDPVQKTWKSARLFDPGSPKMYSPNYRIYLEKSEAGSYRNLVMVRDKIGYGTKQLFKPPETLYEDFPLVDEKVDYVNFTHGSRLRRREVSLVFNAIDTVEGLTDVLNTLAEYNIRTTFFINGEFIRRHPGAVREIADAGHEVGSLFYIHFNMTDVRYQMDKEFIKRGLARNEDDYFQVTRRELSLLWHAPYYFVNSKIIEAANEMNYIHVGRDIDSLDWVTAEQASKSSGVYLPSVELVKRIMELKRPGSIISIRIGQTDGKREDYLFHNLDVLINGLISRGYTIVPVSLLIDHAK